MSRLRKRFCPSTTQPPVDDLSPEDDFDTTISRAGKWSTEEESFAKKLIIQFESGTAKDCEEGCTLRAYLARRLNCAPMRVSKKFAGKCIGKHVFVKSVDGIAHATVKDAEKMLQNPTRRIRNTPKRYRSDSDDYGDSDREQLHAKKSRSSDGFMLSSGATSNDDNDDDEDDYDEDDYEEDADLDEHKQHSDLKLKTRHEDNASWVDSEERLFATMGGAGNGFEFVDESSFYHSHSNHGTNNAQPQSNLYHATHFSNPTSNTTQYASNFDQSATNHLLWSLDQQLSESDSYAMDRDEREADEWRDVLSYFTTSDAVPESQSRKPSFALSIPNYLQFQETSSNNNNSNHGTSTTTTANTNVKENEESSKNETKGLITNVTTGDYKQKTTTLPSQNVSSPSSSFSNSPTTSNDSDSQSNVNSNSNHNRMQSSSKDTAADFSSYSPSMASSTTDSTTDARSIASTKEGNLAFLRNQQSNCTHSFVTNKQLSSLVPGAIIGDTPVDVWRSTLSYGSVFF